MFLKKLIISKEDGSIIRDISFKLGLNLIVDETPIKDGKETGNNVGKTTVLKLIDFCLGGNPKKIYTDEENKKNEYILVKDFLIDEGVHVKLILKEDFLQENSKEVIIERNFLPKKRKIQRIDEVCYTDDGFEEKLKNIFFPNHATNKPTFRQIISHNIRYDDLSLNNTLKTLNSFTRDDEYETLYLFLLGCDFESGNLKQDLRSQISLEEKFKKRLEVEQTKTAYETALNLINFEIEKLEEKKTSLNLNPNFETDLDDFNNIKYDINVVSSEITKLEIRKRLLLEAEQEIKSKSSKVDTNQLKQIYQQATSLIENVQKTFEELNEFHNKMVFSKIDFIKKDLTKIEKEIEDKNTFLKQKLKKETELKEKIIKSDSFETLEELIINLNSNYQRKGEFENILKQINMVEEKLSSLNKELSEIDEKLFSDEFAAQVQHKIDDFNKFFSSVSYELYGEKYALKFDQEIKKGKPIYKFSCFNTNFGSGKKQGEIASFDIAYILYADNKEMPCLHFLLTDKKELMHDNQLINISKLVNARGIQFVTSILKDKLPSVLDSDEYIRLKLSPNDKLFKIEKQTTLDERLVNNSKK